VDVSANNHVLLLQAVNVDVDCAGDGITVKDGNTYVFYSSVTITLWYKENCLSIYFLIELQIYTVM